MHVKVIRVSSTTLKNVLTYEGTINLKASTVVLSDTKNAVALRLDKSGKIKARSFLKFDAELDVVEYANSLHESKLESTFTSEKVPYDKGLSIEVEMKRCLIDAIEKSRDEYLAKYLYYLYFDEVADFSLDRLISSIEESSIDKNMKLYKFLIES